MDKYYIAMYWKAGVKHKVLVTECKNAEQVVEKIKQCCSLGKADFIAYIEDTEVRAVI